VWRNQQSQTAAATFWAKNGAQRRCAESITGYFAEDFLP